jgi:hypothetical protein
MPASEFDELDKAVASVLGTTPSEAPKPTAPTPVVAPAPKPAEPTLVVPPRVRSRGQVMDVVPPLAPRRPAQPVKPVEATASEPVEEPATPSFEQPDPLEFSGFKMDESPAPIEEKPVDIAPEPVVAADEQTEPLTTPFLSDAKVEKRPLGAFSDTPKPDEEKPEEMKPLEVPAEEIAEPVEQQEDLPAELQTDVLSIEATETTATEAAPPVPSIIQQYKEKPSSDDKPSASIYDSEAFHMPLTHTAPKRSGWLIVVWIAALVLVGGGIGVALYFVVLPMLG